MGCLSSAPTPVHCAARRDNRTPTAFSVVMRLLTVASPSPNLALLVAGRAAPSALPRPSRHVGGIATRATSEPYASDHPVSNPSRRRVTLGAAAFAALAYSPAGSSPAAAAMDPLQTLTRRGMAKFARNDVEGSVEDFDLLISSAPSRAPYMWQRGLSLYYLERYADGAAQFRRDVAVNPNDTEEAVWAFLCEARDPSAGFDAARANLLEVGRDPRGYMREAYALFAGDGSEAALRATADGGGAAEDFYSWLYVGLFREARGDAEGAREAMLAAVDTPYGRKSGDYMAALAEVHLKRRGWA